MSKIYHVIVSKQHFDDEDTYLQSFYGSDKQRCAEEAANYVANAMEKWEQDFIKGECSRRCASTEALVKDNCQRSEKRIEELPEQADATVLSLLDGSKTETRGNLIGEAYFHWHRLRLFELTLPAAPAQ